MTAETTQQAGRGRRRAAGLAAVLGLGLAAVWGGLALLRADRVEHEAWPQQQGRLVLEGLSSPAEVLRDGRGIPHARAGSELDALRVLGFLHAQDRLAQMLWLRRVARGRTAEWVGEAGLASDRRMRLLGIGRLADAQARALDPYTGRALEAYASGVNARLARIAAGHVAPPRALRALGVGEPEPWRPADSLALMKLLAWGLGGSLETSLVLNDLIEAVGGLAAQPFFPEGAGIRAVPYGTEARRLPRAPGGDPVRRAAGLAGAGIGSSAWVVGGMHTASGRPLLAADLHHEARVPSALYEVHLRGGPLDVSGATRPGIPVFWLGHNRRVAWAAVHARVVVTDLFRETLDPDDPTRYHDGSGFRPLEVREETLASRGGGVQTLEVRSTRHGPLVHPVVEGAGEALALAWSGARTGPGIGGLLRAARADDAQELRRALARHREPVVAVVYADGDGAAGVQLAGWIPRRRLPSGLVPVPGRARFYDWSSPVPAERLPAARLDEGQGWIVAADGPLPGTSDSGIEWLWRPGERSGRIERLLREGSRAGGLDMGSAVALQADVASARARERVARALDLAGEAPLGDEAAEVARLLRAWDGEMRADSVGAALYHAFHHELVEQLFADRLGQDLLRRYLELPHVSPVPLAARVVASAAKGGGDSSGWDDPARVAAAVRESLHRAWLRLSVEIGPNREKWTWGRLHPLSFRPLLPVRSGLGPFPYGGDAATVAAGGYDPTRPFDARVVSVLRFAADLGEPGYALSALAPGASEHAGHPHRASGLERWLAGRASLLVQGALLVEDHAESRLVLEPDS